VLSDSRGKWLTRIVVAFNIMIRGLIDVPTARLDV
jgi:hypothetical protein